MRGGVKGHLELFLKNIRFGGFIRPLVRIIFFFFLFLTKLQILCCLCCLAIEINDSIDPLWHICSSRTLKTIIQKMIEWLVGLSLFHQVLALPWWILDKAFWIKLIPT